MIIVLSSFPPPFLGGWISLGGWIDARHIVVTGFLMIEFNKKERIRQKGKKRDDKFYFIFFFTLFFPSLLSFPPFSNR